MSHIEQANQEGTTKALVYCRVSTKRQKEEGHGLDSQEHRCRQYAAAKGYEVEAVFPDDISGGGDFMKRPGMVALLAYLDARPDERYVVIFDDLKRYARDTEFHLRLRRIMTERGATRECLNFNFEDSPEGRFFETIAAAQGQLEREQNGRQVSQKMRARVEQGYYCFAPVQGYRYENAPDGGRMLVPDEPNASIIREALTGYAAGRFQSTAEVKRFLEQHPTIRRNRHGEVNWQSVTDMLRRPIYAGRISVPGWGIHLAPAKHEPLISVAEWKKIQDRLDGRANAPARKDFNADFPLRGFVCCSSCGNPMTAAWSKGRNAHYPYYVCYQRGCERRGKSVRKEKVESEFEALLKSLKPAPVLLKLERFRS
jgi:DNA invertase Pin-like site-specific DNA recombinase